jgi:hypothetical protein
MDKNEKKKGLISIRDILIVVANNIFVLYRYEKHLEEAKTSGIKKGAMTGFTMGSVWFLIYCAYALGI